MPSSILLNNFLVFLYCFNIFVSYEFFNFFQNIFNSEAIKVCYISTIPMQRCLINSFWFILIKIYDALSFILGKLLINVHFDNIFVFLNYLKDEAAVKILTYSVCSFTSSILCSYYSSSKCSSFSCWQVLF